MSISEIEERIRERVEAMCDMDPPATAPAEAWTKWKRFCVSEVADIVADELARERRMNESAERVKRAIR